MKLYLSSYGVGDQPEKLQQLVGDNKHVAVIVNAQDGIDPQERAAKVVATLDEMTKLGFTAEELDLRDYFGKQTELAEKLQGFGLVWLRGGNVFVLQRAIRQSGFDAAVRPLVESEQLVFAGYSAGACAATPDLHGIELCDDATEVPEGYNSEIVWEGMGFVPFAIAPHYRSDHFESDFIEQVVSYYEANHVVYEALCDGQAIVIDGQHQETTPVAA